MITIDTDALVAKLAELVREQAGSQWMTLEEAANHIRVSKSWLRQRLGEIPYSRVDGKLLFDRADLDQFVTSHRRETQ